MFGFYSFVEDCSAISEAEPIVISVYPNPTYGKVKIEAEDIRNIIIFNSFGAKIFETPASGDAFEYDFSRQAAGIYFIKVETAKAIETKQVTVL